MKTHKDYISYCIQLAKRAGKNNLTNPQVGSILVYNNRIIGEGFHQKFGDNHAERNAINDALQSYPTLVKDSVLYITLEPCNQFGKTPPCLDYILENKIQKVVIGTKDPNPKVAGSSIKSLKEKGVEVIEGIMEKECVELIAPFKAHLANRPYIILKWAQSKDYFIGKEHEQIWISNEYSKHLAHKWRSEVDGIMVGTNTVLVDNPKLTNRLWTGNNPIRIVFDHHGKIDENYAILDNSNATIKLGQKFKDSSLTDVLSYLYDQGILSILVEGGAKLLSSLIKDDLWDEARVITSEKILEKGIPAPTVSGKLCDSWSLIDDHIIKICQVNS